MIATIVLIVAIAFLLNFYDRTEKNACWSPNYEKLSLEHLEKKRQFSDAEYELIYKQTGLGPPAADKIAKMGQSFKAYQEDFFRSPTYVCEKIGMITYEEKNVDEDGNRKPAFDIPDIQEGDVLITKNTHSMGWRHGHSAIVANSHSGQTLEAVLWGEDSILQRVDKWTGYPSFILLRPKEDGLGKRAAKYAVEDMKGVPYGLFTGIPEKSPEIVKKTQCAHLIWYPYFQAGYDVDSDGGWLVTPNDLANSDFFSVVQVYGVNPEKLWE
ncbi:MAG: hypothetical protein RR131_03270 [Anaerovorax sp.]